MDFNRSSSHGCPCRHCPDKGCGPRHDTCEQYIEWRKRIDERNEAERTLRQSSDVMSEAKKKEVWKNKRYSRQLTYNRSTKA